MLDEISEDELVLVIQIVSQHVVGLRHKQPDGVLVEGQLLEKLLKIRDARMAEARRQRPRPR